MRSSGYRFCVIMGLWLTGWIGIFAFNPANSGAADWYITPRFQMSEKYDTNILLTEKDEIEDFITTVRPQVDATYRTERLSTSLHTYAEYQKYIAESELDTILHNHVLEVSYAVLPTLQVRGSAWFRKDSTLETELVEEGRRFGRENRHRYSGKTGLTYVWSRRLSFSFDVARYYTRYPDNPSDRSDFRTDSLEWTTNIVTSPKTTWVLSLTYQKTKYDNLEDIISSMVDRSIETYGFLPTVQHRFSEDFYATAGFGYRYTRSEFKTDFFPPYDLLTPDQSTDENSSGLLFLLTFHKDWERGWLELKGLRDQYSSLDGESVERSRIELSGRYRFSERWVGMMNTVYTRTDGDVGSDTTDYWSARPSLRFRLRSNVTLQGFLQYALYNSENTDTDRFLGGITLNVEWNRFFHG